jgi:hypothetical protein
MTLVAPFWFKQRQGKAEPAGEDLYRLTGPNLGPAFVGIRKGADGRWAGFVRMAADGPDVEATQPIYPTDTEAWYAAFELYRRHIIV